MLQKFVLTRSVCITYGWQCHSPRGLLQVKMVVALRMHLLPATDRDLLRPWKVAAVALPHELVEVRDRVAVTGLAGPRRGGVAVADKAELPVLLQGVHAHADVPCGLPAGKLGG